MNELALFAGAGGGILGGQLLGWRTVCAVEWEAYPASVLVARQNDGHLEPFPIWDDVRTFDGKPWRGIVDVVSGGFPCQDISAAGKGAGIEGERSGMWGEMARIVCEVRPPFVFVENSPMLTSRGLGRVLGDLAALGYDAEWGVLGAADVGAPHQRERIWIVANARHFKQRQQKNNIQQECNQSIRAIIGNICPDIPDTDSQRCKKQHPAAEPDYTRQYPRPPAAERGETRWTVEPDVAGRWEQQPQSLGKEGTGDVANSDKRRRERPCPAQESESNANVEEGFQTAGWWKAEPNVGRVAHGVALRVDRLKAIGNGQVPQCAAEAFRRLIERFK